MDAITSEGLLGLVLSIIAIGITAIIGFLYLERNNTSKSTSASSLVNILPRTHGELVQKMVAMRMLTRKEAQEAYSRVDRGAYVDRAITGDVSPYLDQALPIGFNATISAPHVQSLGLDLLSEKLQEGAKVLDIGSGSGFMTACLAEHVGPKGKVFAIEHIPELTALGQKNIQKANPHLLGQIEFRTGDGLEGWPEEAPFNVIYAGAAAESLEAVQKLVDQLAPGGRMVIPVGGRQGFHNLLQVDVNVEGEVKVKNHGTVRFVPMTSRKLQLESDVTSGIAFPVSSPDGRKLLVKTFVVPAPDSTIEDYRVLRSKLAKERKETEERKDTGEAK